MAKHDYSPEEALKLIMRKLAARDQVLAQQIQTAVNSGKDIQEKELDRQHQGKKLRSFRRTVAYSPEEALRVVLDCLRAHFVEQPLFVNSLLDNMTPAALATPAQKQALPLNYSEPFALVAIGTEKKVAIELQPETQLLRGIELALGEPETLPLERLSLDDMTRQQANIQHLKELIDFS